MKVADAIANAFVREGTSTIFGLLGDGQVTWWSAISKYPEISIIDVREEGAALSMAEGWSRATGKPGICSTTQGPGLARTYTSLITATRSRTPIVIYTSKTALNDEDALQYLDQQKMVDASGAAYIEVLTPSFAQSAVRQAFYKA